jgi:hypothetical protein
VYENRVLRKIFGPKKEEVVGDWRRLYNEELHKLNTSPNVIRAVKSRRIRSVRKVERVGNMGNAHKILIGKPEWKRHLGRPRRRWEDNIRMNLKE